MTDGSSRVVMLCGLVLLVAGCLATWHTPSEGLIWHRSHGLAVPDLGSEGWERVQVRDAGVAFRSSLGVIAIRAECNGPEGAPLARARDLWLGIDRTELERTERSVGEYPAYQTLARSEQVMVHTVVFRTMRCWVDVAHVAPIDVDDPQVLERFLERIRVEDGA